MGIYTSYRGRIDISPPLPWNLIKDHPALPHPALPHPGNPLYATASDRDVRLVIEKQEIETDDGVLSKRTAVAIEPVTDDPMKGYGMQEHIQEIVDIAPGRTFTGRIDAACETGERWRFKVMPSTSGNGLTVCRYEPELRWPEGAE